MQVMLVDDAIFMREMLRQIIKRESIEIIDAVNGKEAVEKYETHRPDLVFMDITMPDMDGVQALRKIMEIDSNAKVVMCTALAQQTVVAESMRFGAKDYIVKPFNAAKIESIIKRFYPDLCGEK